MKNIPIVSLRDRGALAAIAGLSLAALAFVSLPARADAAPAAQLSSQNANAADQPAEQVRQSTSGFYPIWENTGYVERHRDLFIGTNSADMGVGGVAQLGTNPVLFAYRTPNAYAKFLVYQSPHWHLAVQASMFHLMDSASEAFLSPMYTSRLDNPDFAVNLLPVALSATAEVSDWLALHQTATAFTIFDSDPLETGATFGYAVVAELKARAHHSFEFHAAEVGFWNHDFSLLGASYRYQNSWLEAQFGYFYRYRSDGMESSPLISFGVLL